MNIEKREVHWLWKIAAVLGGIVISLISVVYLLSFNVLKEADARQSIDLQNEIKERSLLQKQYEKLDKNVMLICQTVVGAKCLLNN
jgi:hypothetical protein